LFDQKYSKNSNIVKSECIVKYEAELSASLHQSSVSHDPSKIILICWCDAQETFLITVNIENSCAAGIVHFEINFSYVLAYLRGIQ